MNERPQAWEDDDVDEQHEVPKMKPESPILGWRCSVDTCIWIGVVTSANSGSLPHPAMPRRRTTDIASRQSFIFCTREPPVLICPDLYSDCAISVNNL